MPMTPGFVSKRYFGSAERKALAKEGAAFPDGSYPIVNAEDLHNAIALAHMSKRHSYEEVMAHCRARASALGIKMPEAEKKRELGAFVSKTALLGDKNQSDPVDTDTMQEDPEVDTLKKPKKYVDVLRASNHLKPPVKFTGAQAVPMNVDAIAASFDKAN